MHTQEKSQPLNCELQRTSTTSQGLTLYGSHSNLHKENLGHYRECPCGVQQSWLLRVLRIRQCIQKAMCLVYLGKKTDSNALLHISLTIIPSLIFLPSYIWIHVNQNSPFNCKLVFCHSPFKISCFFHFVEYVDQMLSNILFSSVIFKCSLPLHQWFLVLCSRMPRFILDYFCFFLS